MLRSYSRPSRLRALLGVAIVATMLTAFVPASAFDQSQYCFDGQWTEVPISNGEVLGQTVRLGVEVANDDFVTICYRVGNVTGGYIKIINDVPAGYSTGVVIRPVCAADAGVAVPVTACTVGRTGVAHKPDTTGGLARLGTPLVCVSIVCVPQVSICAGYLDIWVLKFGTPTFSIPLSAEIGSSAPDCA